MLHRFSDNAKAALNKARFEAERFHHEYLGTEHLLLGILELSDCSAVLVLKNMGIDPAQLRAQTEKLVKSGKPPGQIGQLPFTPGAKRALELSMEQAGALGHILDQNIKFVDPFMTGANALNVQLQVPAEVEAEAREMLAWRPEEDVHVSEASEPAEDRVHKLGVRIRWASLVSITAPYALVLAWPYFRGVKELGHRPEDHGWRVAALGYSAGVITVVLSIFFGRG